MLALLLILLAVASRLVPHLNNAAAVTAVAIVAGALLPKKQAFIVPLAARLITDLAIGIFAWQLMLVVYAAHVFGVLLGIWIKQSRSSSIRWVKVLSSGVGAAMVFFLLTNFAFFYPEYSHTWSGIAQAYANGLPFLRGTIIGDVAYTAGLFLVLDLATMLAPKLATRTLENHGRP